MAATGPALTSELARSVDDPSTFDHIVADRLFHIHVLASLHRPDRCQCMPVIRCADEDDIDRFIIDHRTQVLHLLRHRAAEFNQQRADFIGPVEIGIADVRHITVD